MCKFIEITDRDRGKVLVNVSHISMIYKSKTGYTKIHVSSIGTLYAQIGYDALGKIINDASEL